MKNIITIVACSILLESISAGNITNSGYDFFEKQIPVAVSSQSQLSDSEQTMKALPEIDRIKELEQLPLPGIESIDPVLAAVGGYLWKTGYPNPIGT